MITPRWHKVLADLWSNKTRTLLTILTIAVGVMAVGFIRGMAVIMLEDMNTDFQSAHPHEAILYTAPFDEPMVHAARHVPGVLDAEGRGMVYSRVIVSADKKVNITITSVPDPARMRIDLLRPVMGTSLPPLDDHELWIEASSLSLLPVKVGDMDQHRDAGRAPAQPEGNRHRPRCELSGQQFHRPDQRLHHPRHHRMAGRALDL